MYPRHLRCLWDLKWRSHASFAMTPLIQPLTALTFLKSREQSKWSKLMLLITKGSPSTLHTLKLIIQGGVSTRILVGRIREAKTIFQITKVRTSKTKAFQIKPLNSKIKVLEDFLQILTKGFTPLLKGIKTNSFTNLHIREVWRILEHSFSRLNNPLTLNFAQP